MRGYELSTLESEFALPEWGVDLDTEWENDPDAERRKRLRRQGSLRRQALARIFGLILGGPLPMPALPQERPAIVAEDPRRRGGQGGRESEAELKAVRAHYSEARLMEQLGKLATRTSDKGEAEAFISALLPLACRVVPRAEPALMRAAPRLVHGLAGATRVLRSHPATRPLIGRLPTVARRTAVDLGHRASMGLPIPPKTAVRALAHQAVRVLGEEESGRAAKLLGGGPSRRPAGKSASAGKSPRFDPPNYRGDRRTAGTGGIEAVHVVTNSRNELVVTIYGEILRPLAKRRGLEITLPSPEQVKSLQWRCYERAHLWGSQFGDEAAAGVMYAPALFNRGKQAVLENTLSSMQKNLRPEERLILKATATSFPKAQYGGPVLRRVEYEFAIVDRKNSVTLERHKVQFDIGPPPPTVPPPPTIQVSINGKFMKSW